MTSVEIRLREENGVNVYRCYCTDCWEEIPMTTEPSESDHRCNSIKDITVFRFELCDYEDEVGIHPEDYLTTQGFEVVAFASDQADYACWVAIKGKHELPIGIHPSITIDNSKANEMKLI